MRVSILAVAASLTLLNAVLADPASAAIRKNTNIPAEPLSEALRTLAKDRQFEILYRAEAVRDLKTGGAVGELTSEEALQHLLSGTGLSYKYLNASTVTVYSPLSSPAGDVQQSQTAGQDSSKEGAGKKSSQDFRVAQVDQAPAGPPVSRTTTEESKRKDQLEEVVVTGTNIRGIETPVTPVLTLSRQAIEQSGHLNTDDLLQSLPQAFAGGSQGASPDGMLGTGANAGNNNEHATAVNLRGLGENDTLTLLNGHRIAPSAYGNVVDISTIPLSAIDHIDVLTDGASAVYGADAVGGVVNIVLRKDVTGAQTSATYGGVTSGDLRETVASQTYGTQWSTGSVFLAYEYKHEGSLSTTERSFTESAPTPTNIINPLTQNSIALNADQKIGDRVGLYADSLLTWKTTGTILTQGVGSVTNDSFSNPHAANGNLGARVAITDSWSADVSGTYARQSTDTGYHSYPYGTVPLGTPIYFFKSTIKSADLKVDGSLFRLPGGEVKTALGFTSRHEDAVDSDIAHNRSYEFHRRVTAEFAELYVPIVGRGNSLPLVDQLALTAAIRNDSYSDFGRTTNPKIGLLWAPISSIAVRANWSRSFRPPSMGEGILSAQTGAGMYNYLFVNPNGPGNVPVFLPSGVDPHLGPETARNINVGLDFKPVTLPALTVSVSYYDIYFHNRIFQPPFDTTALLHPDIYGSLITYLPTQAAADQYLAAFQATGGNWLDFLGTGAAGVRYVYDTQLGNAAVVRQNGFDLRGHYDGELLGNSFRTDLLVASINKVDIQYSSTSTAHNAVNTYSNPLRWRARLQEQWARGPFDVSGALNFANSYSDTSAVPVPQPAASWTTFDLSAAYHVGSAVSEPLRGLTVRLSALNLFDRAPPYVSGVGAGVPGIHYDVGNASAIGRFLSLSLTKDW